MVQHVRKRLGIRRVGHTGTLDPFASGLLVICVGKATRLAEYYQALPKTYVARIRFGYETDTGDITGQPIAPEMDAPWDSARIEEVLQDFKGPQWQVPPSYSAKRIEGRRAHVLARAGEKVELEPREVHVHDITVMPQTDEREMTLQVTCGAGTYIRSLAQDIARRAGTRACLSALRRTSLGNLMVGNAWKLNDLRNAKGWKFDSKSCLKPGTGLPWPRLACGPQLAKKLGHGQIALINEPEFSLAHGEKALAMTPEGDLLGVLAVQEELPGQDLHVKAVKWFATSS